MKTNPFKLKGSYIGFFIGLIAAYFVGFSLIFYLAETGKFHFLHILIPLFFPVFGFMVGWKMNSYILNKKNKK